MIYQFILIVLICLKRHACQSIHHCMYAESFECMSSTSPEMISEDYYFTFNWNSVQNSITSSTFSFAGYQMARMNTYMSFAAYFYVVTSTYGRFQFIPISTRFFKAKFYFMLFRPCADKVVVNTIGYFGSINAILQLSVGLIFETNTTRYIRTAFIQSISQPNSVVAIGNIKIDLLPIQPGINYENIQVNTAVQIYIQIGYILIVTNSKQALLQMYQSYSLTGYQQLKASAIYAPNGKYKCFVGLSIVNELPSPTTPYFLKGLDFTSDPSYEVIFDYTKSSFNHGKFILFCLAKCSPANMVPDYSTTPLSCIIAQIPKCIQPLNATHCKVCQNRYYNNVSWNCDLCSDGFSNCDQCSNISCSKCLDNYMLLTQGSNISCVNCNIGIAHCLTCNSYSCLSCQNGFYAYSFCPYPNNCTDMCLPCLQQCFSCTNSSTCVECKIGFLVQGGCTDITSCARVNSNASYLSSRCIGCSFPALLSANGRCEKCQQDYWYARPYCVKTVGCIFSMKINQTIICITCDFNQHFQMRPINYSCYCMKSFSIVNNKCQEICGDGQTYTLECDDGNLQDGDGCSSKCTVEKGFSCINSQNQSSHCKYYRRDIILQLQKIEKIRFQNKAIMTFALKPEIPMDKLIKNFIFSTNRSCLIQNKSLKKNKLTLQILFNEDLENYNAIMTVLFQNIVLNQLKAELQFKMQKNGLLIILRNTKLFEWGIKFSNYLMIAIIIIFVVTLFFHKIIGLQFLFPFQVIYLLYISNTQPTIFQTLLNSSGFSCFNFLLIYNDYTNVLTNGFTQQFSDQDMGVSIKVMFIAIVSLSIIKITKLIIKIKCIDKKWLQKSHILQYLYFVFDNFLFSLSIGFMMVSFIMLIGKAMRYEQTFLKILMFPIQIITSLQYFKQWRTNLSDYKTKTTSFVIPYLPRFIYVPIFLIFYISASLIFVLASLNLIYEIQIAFIMTLLLFLTIIIAHRPYKTFLDNFGIIFSVLITIFSCIWLKIRNQQSKYRSEQNQILILVVLTILMLASAIITIVRIIRIIQKMCRQSSKKKQFPQQIIDQREDEQYSVKIQRKEYGKRKNKYLLHQDIPLSEFKQALHQKHQNKLSFLALTHKTRKVGQK